MDDRTLLASYATTGSHDTFAALAMRYVPMIRAAARRLVRDPHLVEDITQLVLMTLMRKAAQFPADAPVAAWLSRVTRYVAADALRARASRQHHERLAAAQRSVLAAPSRFAAIERTDSIVTRTLNSLSREDRAIVAQRYFQDLKTHQIAAAMQLSEAAVRQRLSRALRRMRLQLAGEGIGGICPELIRLLAAPLGWHANATAPAAPTALKPPIFSHTAAAGWGLKALLSASAALLVAGGAGVALHRRTRPIPQAVSSVPAATSNAPASGASRVFKSRNSPLIVAVMQRNEPRVRDLLDAGADVETLSQDGQKMPAMMFACFLPRDSGLKIVQSLVEHGADVNARHGQWGYTAVMAAARAGSPETVQYLVAHGADVNSVDPRGQTAMSMALASGNSQAVEAVRALSASR
jgi:RNA polymerase sigma factor (sigma-70 family)